MRKYDDENAKLHVHVSWRKRENTMFYTYNISQYLHLLNIDIIIKMK